MEIYDAFQDQGMQHVQFVNHFPGSSEPSGKKSAWGCPILHYDGDLVLDNVISILVVELDRFNK